MLFNELITFTSPIGVILISSNSVCVSCNSKLVLRKDRPAPVVIYDDTLGTYFGSHFHKFCPKKGCSFNQYYGYYTIHSHSSELPYFVSSKKLCSKWNYLGDLMLRYVMRRRFFDYDQTTLIH